MTARGGSSATRRAGRARFTALFAALFAAVAGPGCVGGVPGEGGARPARLVADPTVGDAAARALFQRGREAMQRGDSTAACPMFAEAQRLDPSSGVLLNLAVCQEKLGRVASSWLAFRELSEVLPSDDPRRAVADAAAARLEPRLPRLRLSLAPGAPAETRLSLDGVTLGAASLGTRIPVDPGRHRLEVKSAGRSPTILALDVREAEVVERAVAPGPLVFSVPPALGYGLAGFSAASWLTVGVLGGMVLSEKGVVDQHCHAFACDPEGLAAASTGRVLSQVEVAAAVAGAVSAAAGGTILILAARSRAEAPAVSAAVTPAGAWLMVTTRF